jgi:hypothetical protein
VSAFTKAPYGQLAGYLEDYGYRPVPIKPGFKAPLLDGWQAGHPRSHYLPRCASWGTGILTATCPAIDLDIRDRELVRVLLELAGDTLGYTPFRIGSPPKALLPFSTLAPFDKISGRWWALPGEDWSREGYSPHRVEILGKGQQFLAYARHPRGTFYRWRRGEPMDTPLVDLPEIDETGAKAFLWAAHAVARDVAAVPLRKDQGRWLPCSWEPSDFGEPEPDRGQSSRRRDNSIAGDRSWQSIEPERLAKLIDRQNARPLKDGGWITACPAHASKGARSLSITKREGGGSVVFCFGECPFGDIANAISAIVGRAA